MFAAIIDFSLENLLASRKNISQKQIGEFTDQLATVLNSGMPLERSLSVMIDLIDEERLRIMVEQVRDKVRGGGTLSDALEDQHVFSNMYTNMVRAGEVGGTLEVTLQRLSDYLARAKALKDSVGISAMRAGTGARSLLFQTTMTCALGDSSRALIRA